MDCCCSCCRLSALSATAPAALDGPLLTIYGAAFAKYRAFMMALSLLYAVLRISRAGLIVRAALTQPGARWLDVVFRLFCLTRDARGYCVAA
jgi:hypothetical protein